MPKIFVHDFYFEFSDIETTISENDFHCSLTVYFNFSKENPGDGWDNLEYFNITVATPSGLAKYLNKCIAVGICPDAFFISSILFFSKNDKSAIMRFVKQELESIHGKSEKELILKAIRKFTWESENVPEVYDKLFQ